MNRQLVIVLRVLNPFIPMEIEGNVDGRPFYYRQRGDRWTISTHVVDWADKNNVPIAEGTADEAEDNLATALNRILWAFQDVLERFDITVDATG